MKYIKAGDILIVLLGFFSIIFYIRYRQDNKSNVIIIETPKSKYRYLIDSDRLISVDGILGECMIEIKDKSVHFLQSGCRDKICIKAGDLRYTPVICLPNGISIYYENLKTDDGEDIDSFVQ